MTDRPKIAIIGAGIFVKNQYIPRLAEISDLFVLKSIWSRTQESAEAAVELAKKYFPEVESKWGDKGLDEVIEDNSIIGVAVVLAAHTQVDISFKLLEGGKHVLQEKPAAACLSEAEKAISYYNTICTNSPGYPIWSVAENYRFEPAFVEGKKLVAELGDLMSVQVIIEGSMNNSNPYFSSSWRRNCDGGFILDMGVHYVAGLRMLVGCDLTSVCATTSHVDQGLPPPDCISCVFHLENGCAGVFVMVVASRSPKVTWRVIGLKGTLLVERGIVNGRNGYQVTLYGAGGANKSTFYPFSGVTEELKTFLKDISLATQNKSKGSSYTEADPRLSYVEGARDIAVLDAMLQSGTKQGSLVQIKKF
jgi:predicted dehydrogenase